MEDVAALVSLADASVADDAALLADVCELNALVAEADADVCALLANPSDSSRLASA